MTRRLALLLALLLASPLWGQSVKLPKEVKGDPGAWVVVVPESKDGGEVKWRLSEGLTPVPIDKLFPGQKAAGVVFTGKKGRHQVWAWNAKGDVASDLAVCEVVIGDPPDPGPGPGPGPNPPEPTPTGDKWMVIVYETMDTLPAGQASVLTSAKVRAYLRSKLKKASGGLPDGEFVIWDKDTDPAGYPKEWAERFTRAKAGGKLPHVVLSDGKKVTDFELPAGVDEFLALLKKQLGE